MTHYRASFFKNLLSSDGRPFKCLQQAIEIRHAKNAVRAVEAAKRRYERRHYVSDWTLYADIIELEIDGTRVDFRSMCAEEASLASSHPTTRTFSRRERSHKAKSAGAP